MRANAESDRPTLYYSPPRSAEAFGTAEADRIVERGFEQTLREVEDEMGDLMLWAFQPDDSDGVQGDVLVEVVLDCPVREYEQRTCDGHGISEIAADQWRCECGLEFTTRKVAVEHLAAIPDSERVPTGRFFIPIDVVNARTVSRRRVIPDFE